MHLSCYLQGIRITDPFLSLCCLYRLNSLFFVLCTLRRLFAFSGFLSASRFCPPTFDLGLLSYASLLLRVITSCLGAPVDALLCGLCFMIATLIGMCLMLR